MREKKLGGKVSAGFPIFKSKERYSSITYPQSGFRIMDNDHVRISKTGEVRMFMHRPIIGNVSTLSVKRDHAGDWFMTIVTDNLHETQQTEKEEQPHVTFLEFTNPVGIDLGLKALITTSDGEQIEPPVS